MCYSVPVYKYTIPTNIWDLLLLVMFFLVPWDASPSFTTIWENIFGSLFPSIELPQIQGMDKYQNLGGGNAHIVYLHQTKVKQHIAIEILGGGNSTIFFHMFTPKIGEDEPILTSIFQLKICCFSPPLGRSFLGDARNLSGLLAGLGAWASSECP